MAKGKLHISDLKQAILKYIKENKKKLAKTFVPRQSEEYMEKALIPRFWVRIDKGFPVSYDYEIVHTFDCRPYKGELRAYVYTSRNEKEIINVVVQTE